MFIRLFDVVNLQQSIPLFTSLDTNTISLLSSTTFSSEHAPYSSCQSNHLNNLLSIFHFFFTIVRGDGYATETTGLAFSPDHKFMYVAFQGNSNIYAFWRTDGLAFNAVKADIKYHDA